MKAKIINGELEYFKQPDWILGDASKYATKNGYKEVIYQNGDKGTYETNDNIIVETPIPVLTVDEQRRQAYGVELSVNWQDKLMTVDAANSLYLYYRAEADDDRAEAIQLLIKEAKTTIREKYQ